MIPKHSGNLRQDCTLNELEHCLFNRATMLLSGIRTLVRRRLMAERIGAGPIDTELCLFNSKDDERGTLGERRDAGEDKERTERHTGMEGRRESTGVNIKYRLWRGHFNN